MKPVESAPRQLRAQRRHARRARRAVAAILERLETGLEHGAQSIEREWRRATARSNGRLRRRENSVVQPSSVDTPFEREAVDRRRSRRCVRPQQAGKDDAAAGGGELRQRRGHPLQRPEQDIGEDDIERRVPARTLRAMTPLAVTTVTIAPARFSRALARATRNGAGVDVGCEHVPPQGARRGDGEDAAAGAEIED